MQRPHSIVMFERLYLGAWLLSAVNIVINRAAVDLAARSVGAPGLIWGFTLLWLMLPLLLWYFAARRASVVAKWIIVVLLAMTTFGIARALVTGTTQLGLASAAGIVELALQFAAVAMLFRADARAWFAAEADDETDEAAAADAA